MSTAIIDIIIKIEGFFCIFFITPFQVQPCENGLSRNHRLNRRKQVGSWGPG